MKKEKAEQYLQNRKEELLEEKVVLSFHNNKHELEIEEIDKIIDRIEQNIDVAYEIFSPRNRSHSFNKDEVENLKKQKEEITEQIQVNQEKIEQLDEEIESIISALLEKEEANIREEQQKGNDSKIVQQLKMILHKTEVCSKIIDLDKNRTKTELKNISTSIEKLIQTIEMEKKENRKE